MSFGRRSGPPSAPPIPVPPPPPSAYGLVVPGAPPLPQQFTPQEPPPPPAPPAVEAARPYTPPADLSGFFGGPVAPAAPSGGFGAPAPSQFGAPTQSQFGGAPPSHFGGQPTAPYGAPAWSSAPAKSSNRVWRRIVVGVVVLAVIAGGGTRLHDYLTMHHLSTLPATVGDLNESQNAGLQAGLSSVKSSVATGRFHSIKDLQAVLYYQGTSPVIVVVGIAFAGSQRHAREFFADSGTTVLDTPFHDVTTSGSFGGTARCGSATFDARATAAVCGWIDNGTLGLVMVVNGDEATALADLSAVRAAAEH